MTRLAVLADIHGNLPALQAVIDDMAQFAVDQVVVAGDSINWGPFSREVLEVIRERRWPVIRGNNELYLLDYDTERCGVSAHLVIEEFRRARLHLAAYIDWKAKHHDERDDSPELLREFRNLDDVTPYLPPAYRGLTSALYRD